ncbi:hypothetical protein SKAU_G00206800 [Synaphobranchus kaupii]|uniref:Uncharacterized protein n=1 Tax=Synaphobranchus kaupii TaxID=118154 RepID=A0A9Q1F8K0_SYNKA|nr:hypothetical protein SKAU_G00206800 [Synaphobranchus kaupii]
MQPNNSPKGSCSTEAHSRRPCLVLGKGRYFAPTSRTSKHLPLHSSLPHTERVISTAGDTISQEWRSRILPDKEQRRKRETPNQEGAAQSTSPHFLAQTKAARLQETMCF